MAVEAIRCPHCQSEAVVKYGTTSNGKERFRCQRGEQCGRTFFRSYACPGRTPEVKRQIIEMTLNGSGVHDIARVLRVSPTTVMGELKKRPRDSPRARGSSYKAAVRTRGPLRCGAWRQRRRMKCGVSYRAKPTSAGDGMRVTI
jgi:transposase-like protein